MVSVDDDEGQVMKRTIFLTIVLLVLSQAVLSQEPDKNAAQPETPASAAIKRLTIEVTGGDKNVAVENASVYLKYVEEKKLGKDRKYALNVKTNRDGAAHVPDPPLGKVLIQIVADGWKTYGKYYELTDPGAVIKIHLDRPPKWY
jgi:hypothetical protein